MQIFNRRSFLQFFADGAPGGDGSGASTGVSAVDAGQQTGVNTAAAGQPTKTLEELGVPKALAEKHRARKGAKPVAAESVNSTLLETQAEKPAAETPVAANTSTQDIDWDEAIKRPEFAQRVQDVVRARVKKMQDVFDGLSPALKVIGEKYNIDTSDISKMDVKAFSDAVTSDKTYYGDYAAELGTDIDTAMDIHQKLSKAASAEAQANKVLEDIKMRQHFDKMTAEAETLKQDIPGFNLEQELKNPQFLRMTSPEGGLSVEQAYYALHHREVMQAKAAQTAQAAKQALSNSVQAGQSMPRENGTANKAASNVAPKLYSQMNPAERAEYKKRLQMGR